MPAGLGTTTGRGRFASATGTMGGRAGLGGCTAISSRPVQCMGPVAGMTSAAVREALAALIPLCCLVAV